MKVRGLHGIGNLRCEETAKPKAGKGEVLIKIKASGICWSDIGRMHILVGYRKDAYKWRILQ